jgi:hypothetical protein
MLYMLIERYTKGPKPIYERARTNGRMLPEGLHYLDSWVVDDDNLDRCFQLMETHDPSLFDEWLSKWDDLAEFEILPVIKSSEASSRLDISWSGDDT